MLIPQSFRRRPGQIIERHPYSLIKRTSPIRTSQADSRGVNKIYGTTIIIGQATRAAAGNRVSVRELDAVAVYGRSEGTRIYELIGLQAGSDVIPEWVATYEEALSLYRTGRFGAALKKLNVVEKLRPGDGPARRLETRCRGFLAEPPSASWIPVTMLDTK